MHLPLLFLRLLRSRVQHLGELSVVKQTAARSNSASRRQDALRFRSGGFAAFLLLVVQITDVTELGGGSVGIGGPRLHP